METGGGDGLFADLYVTVFQRNAGHPFSLHDVTESQLEGTGHNQFLSCCIQGHITD